MTIAIMCAIIVVIIILFSYLDIRHAPILRFKEFVVCICALDSTGLEDLPPVPPSEIRFNYALFNKESNGVTIGWTVPENNQCNLFNFQLQGYTLSTLQSNNLGNPQVVVLAMSSQRAVLSSDQLQSGTNDLYYRIVTVFENGTVCQNLQTDSNFYRFTGEDDVTVSLFDILYALLHWH